MSNEKSCHFVCSKCEAVLLHSDCEVGLQVALALLSDPVAVEGGWLPA